MPRSIAKQQVCLRLHAGKLVKLTAVTAPQRRMAIPLRQLRVPVLCAGFRKQASPRSPADSATANVTDINHLLAKAAHPQNMQL